MAALTEPKIGSNIFLFDGVCGLCNRLVNFVLPRDTTGKFQFASLQSDFARDLLAQYNIDSSVLKTFYTIADYGLPNQRILSKSDAAVYVLEQLGGIWRFVAWIKFIPKFIRDWGYEIVATNRYQLFGKHDTCRLPTGDERDRFIEV